MPAQILLIGGQYLRVSFANHSAGRFSSVSDERVGLGFPPSVELPATRHFPEFDIHGKCCGKFPGNLEAFVAQGSAPSPSDVGGKRRNFVRLAENRTRNAIRAVRVIGKLSNKKAYQYDDTDVQKIVRALAKEVDALRARLAQTGSKDTIDFSL